MRLNRRNFTIAGLASASAMAFPNLLNAQTPKVITAGTAGPGSVAFIWVSSLGNLLEQTGAPVRMRVAASLFDVEAMRVLENHGAGVEASFVSGSSLIAATLGRPPFADQPTKNLRGLFPIGTAPISIVVRKDSGITSIHELGGRRLSAGPAGTGNDQFARAFFKRVVPNSVSWVPLAYSAFASSLQDRKVEALVVLGTPPYPAVIESASLVDLTYLSMSDDDMKKWLPDNPQHHPMRIPAGVYPKQDNDIVTFGHVSHFVASDSMDDSTAEVLTKTWLDPVGRKKLLEASVSWQSAFDAFSTGLYGKDVNGMKLTMHPGALKVFKANGGVPGLD